MVWRSVPPGTLFLIAGSVAVYLVDAVSGGRILLAGAKSSAIWAGEWHRLITANFIHSGLTHLLVNMYALWIFGRLVEEITGTRRFLAVYFIGGLVGFYASLLANPAGLSVGASAAIFSLMGYTVHYRLRRLPLRWLPIDSALAQILVLNLIIGFTVPNIDQFAHGGGLLGGALAGSITGVPGRGGRSRIGVVERGLAVALLALVSWAGLAPISFAAGLGGISPGLERAMRDRFDRYFASFVVVDPEVFWVDPSREDIDWRPVPDALARPAESPLALGVFWRWERGGGASQAADYTVTWRVRARESESWRTVHTDRGRVSRADPRGDTIYRRSFLVQPAAAALAGAWNILVEVDGTLQYERTFQVTVRD